MRVEDGGCGVWVVEFRWDFGLGVVECWCLWEDWVDWRGNLWVGLYGMRDCNRWSCGVEESLYG